MSTASEDPGHGHSPAAWTAVVIMIFAVAVGTLAFWLALPWLVAVAVVILLIGLLVGWLLKRAGYGVNGAKYLPKAH